MQDLLRFVADDELVAHGSPAIRSIRHDFHRPVYAANKLNLHGSSTMRAFDSSYRRLDPLLQSWLELLAGGISWFVKYLSVTAMCEDILSQYFLL